jgi:hypothetical protein
MEEEDVHSRDIPYSSSSNRRRTYVHSKSLGVGAEVLFLGTRWVGAKDDREISNDRALEWCHTCWIVFPCCIQDFLLEGG